MVIRVTEDMVEINVPAAITAAKELVKALRLFKEHADEAHCPPVVEAYTRLRESMGDKPSRSYPPLSGPSASG